MTAEVSYLTWQGGEVPKKKYTKYLAYDTMAPCLVLRTRRPGDYLMVNAAHGRRKLKDYLIDEKVPRLMRDSIPLIAQGSHVLWVIGKRISEGAKVREGTECVRITVSGFQ
jgi:tRNA(Ile)-lysidine synthase